MTIKVPLFQMPPPSPSASVTFPVMRQELRVSVPVLKMPPPTPALPFWMVNPEIDTVIPLPMLNTFTAPPPSMAKLEAPGPVMVMVWVSAGKAPSKLMVPVTANVIVTPPDEALALVIAARSDPAPLSASVVTTSDADVTEMLPDVPVIDDVTVSVAVIVWFPAVFNVAENVPTPLVSVESAGNVAKPSLLVKCTVPAYPVEVLLN